MTVKVLITGANGFLGSNLVEYFYKNTNYKIFALSRNSVERKISSSRIQYVCKDLVENNIADADGMPIDVDYVIHLAGSSNVKNSFKYPLQCFNDNVIATSNLLEWCRNLKQKTKKFIFFSTAEVFGDSDKDTKFSEYNSKSPQSPYAYTKMMAEDACKMYKNIYNIPVIITYTMNIYGKNQSNYKFIPKIIDLITNSQEVALHGKSNANKRNYLHVDDACDAVHFILDNGMVGEKYNIVSDKCTDNLQIALLLAKLLDKKLKYKIVYSQQHHAKSILCNSKLEKLGWLPKISLEAGLKKYINEK